MTKGRKPNPDHLRLVDRPVEPVGDTPETETKAAANKKPDVVELPAHFTKASVAAKEFRRVVAELKKVSKWSPMFLRTVAAYAQAYEDWIEAEKALRAGKAGLKGKVVTSPKGYPIQNPWLAIRNRAKDDMIKHGSEFGLTLISFVRMANAQLDLFGDAADEPKDKAVGGGTYDNI